MTATPDISASANRLLIAVGMLVRIFACGVGGRGCLFGHALISGPGLRQKLIDLPSVLRYRVRHEGQSRSELEAELLAHLRSQQAGGGRERGRGSCLLLIRAQHGVEGGRLAAVAREPYVIDRDEA